MNLNIIYQKKNNILVRFVLKKMNHVAPQARLLDEWYLEFKKRFKINVGMFRINQEVAWYHNIEPHDLHKKTRKLKYTEPRQIAQYIMYEHGHKQTRISEFYKCDQSTVSHSCSTIDGLMETEEKIRIEISEIYEKIFGGQED